MQEQDDTIRVQDTITKEYLELEKEAFPITKKTSTDTGTDPPVINELTPSILVEIEKAPNEVPEITRLVEKGENLMISPKQRYVKYKRRNQFSVMKSKKEPLLPKIMGLDDFITVKQLYSSTDSID